MSFSEETVRLAWAWAARRCTCKRDGHGHLDRCERDIVWRRRGVRGSGGWDTRHRVTAAEGGKDEPENCEILCWACHAAGAPSATGPRDTTVPFRRQPSPPPIDA
jgi:5-methylcytosine-specific restriction endonuclease McrA